MLLLQAVSPVVEPSFDLSTLGGRTRAEAAIDAERAVIGFGPSTACPQATGGEIVVCGRRGPDPNRLPLRDQRFAEGEVVRIPGEPDPAGAGHSCARPGACEPSKLGETVGKILNFLAGNDPPPP